MKYNKQNYRQILEKVIARGYKFANYLDIDLESSKKQIILRHDIDYSVGMALEMARIDASYSVRSTFAVLLSSPLYNPLSPANIEAIDEIHTLGHHIALHHLWTLGRPEEEIRLGIVRGMQVMKHFFPYIQPVFVWHNLMQSTLSSQVETSDIVNACGTKVTEKMHYISDSVTRRTPEELLSAVGQYKLLNMLIHPLIWMGEKDDMVSMISHTLIGTVRSCGQEFLLNPAWREKFPCGVPAEVLKTLQESLEGNS